MLPTPDDTADKDTRTVGLSERGRDELFVANRRRVALAILDERTEPLEVDELAAAIAKREAEEAASIERIAITLHHAHLPRMADAGVVDYDTQDRRIDPAGFSLESVRRN
ncbi:hypothetical protein [Natronococcus sp.]|uniref:DUF7344 domain-containing protein n=1 Tax=Natronococcus sp. TaxID=35747 RepID=UPI003A4D4C46